LPTNIHEKKDTHYDKATAVNTYPRKTLNYIQKLQSPPQGKDPLEWVLFEYKQAYCVYYATSEILMLRSVGIPARMAVGFTQGSALTVDIGPGQQPRVIDGTYVVMRNNAHAWPEVYFPGIGWVEFEPTAGEAPLDRPQPILASENEGGPVPDLRTEENQDPALDEPDAGTTDTPVPETAPSLAILYLLPLVIAGAALTIFLNRRYSLQARVPVFLRATLERSGVDVPVWVTHWEKWVKLSLIEKSFESINFALRWLDKPLPVHATPSERAAKLTSILPEQSGQIKVLLDEHQTSLYTSRIGNATQARRAAFDIRKQVIIQRIRRFFFGKPLS
ncbi:MAG: transglutaminase-like domain-containing protein, partial [Chloroflexota bacterium]